MSLCCICQFVFSDLDFRYSFGTFQIRMTCSKYCWWICDTYSTFYLNWEIPVSCTCDMISVCHSSKSFTSEILNKQILQSDFHPGDWCSYHKFVSQLSTWNSIKFHLNFSNSYLKFAFKNMNMIFFIFYTTNVQRKQYSLTNREITL